MKLTNSKVQHESVSHGAEMNAEQIAKERADWLLDAVATATQNRMFLRGDDAYDEVAGEAILLCGEKAILTAIRRLNEQG